MPELDDLTFKGRWDETDPPECETMTVYLHCFEAGEIVSEPETIRQILKASGYRLTLEKVTT